MIICKVLTNIHIIIIELVNFLPLTAELHKLLPFWSLLAVLLPVKFVDGGLILQQLDVDSKFIAFSLKSSMKFYFLSGRSLFWVLIAHPSFSVDSPFISPELLSQCNFQLGLFIFWCLKSNILTAT